MLDCDYIDDRKKRKRNEVSSGPSREAPPMFVSECFYIFIRFRS